MFAVGKRDFHTLRLVVAPDTPPWAEGVPVDPDGSSDDGGIIVAVAAVVRENVVDHGYDSAVVLRTVVLVVAVVLIVTDALYPVPFPTVVHGVEVVSLIARPRVVLAERVKRDVERGVIRAVVVVHITGDVSEINHGYS